jgi:hypothetical protein
MAVSTTQSIWRSGGGDQTRTAYCGTGVMVAEFYIDPTADDTATAKISSAANAPAVVLPAGAVILQIQANAAGTGGTTPTFDMGWIGYSNTAQSDPNGLISLGDADAGKQIWNWTSATAGDDLGLIMQADQMVTITGGGTTGDKATGGTITGEIIYYVTDPLIGQQSA